MDSHSLTPDPNVIYYSHWAEPAFRTDQFSRWTNWERYGKHHLVQPAFDDVTRRNLKLFFHPSYPSERLETVADVLDHYGLKCVARMKDRVIFEHVDDKDNKDDKDNPSSEPLSPSPNLFIKDLVYKMADNAVHQHLTKERKKVNTFPPGKDFYSGGYFVKTNGDGWKYHCKSYRSAVYWKRYYAKYHPDEPLIVERALYRFFENEILPGGHWVNTMDDSEVDGLFYKDPPELIDGDHTRLTMSQEILLFDIPQETERKMVKFMERHSSPFTTRVYATLPYGSIPELHKALKELCVANYRNWLAYMQLSTDGVHVDNVDIDSIWVGKDEYVVEFHLCNPRS